MSMFGKEKLQALEAKIGELKKKLQDSLKEKDELKKELEASRKQISDLQAKWDANEGNHQHQAPYQISNGRFETTKDEPDDVSYKLHIYLRCINQFLGLQVA